MGRNWLRKMADAEDEQLSIAVAGLAADMGFIKSGPAASYLEAKRGQMKLQAALDILGDDFDSWEESEIVWPLQTARDTIQLALAHVTHCAIDWRKEAE